MTDSKGSERAQPRCITCDRQPGQYRLTSADGRITVYQCDECAGISMRGVEMMPTTEVEP